MKGTKPTLGDELDGLPLLALVGYAARCARRAYLHLLHTEGAPGVEYRVVVEAALAAAERVAAGLPFESNELAVAGDRVAALAADPRYAGTRAAVARSATAAVITAYQAAVEKVVTSDDAL